jgi:hypothetical protein
MFLCVNQRRKNNREKSGRLFDVPVVVVVVWGQGGENEYYEM